MEFAFYGGAGEVGRSCVSVNDEYLFDAGLKISEEGSEYPLSFNPENVKGVFLSHAHLDHCGALPLFNSLGLRCGVYCNSMTKEITKILLKDSLHIEMLTNKHPEYNKSNINNIMSYMQNAGFGKQYSLGDSSFTFYDAGHIPGSASILLETGGKRILYTGDINSCETRLMAPGKFDKIKDIDVMIIETTYGDRDHPDRQESETEFLDMVQKTIKAQGSVIIPAFAVGRAQEIMLLLAKRKFNAPIYLDGMAKKVTNILLKKPEFIKSSRELDKATRNVKFVANWKERKQVAGGRGIFITTSGMLDGGPVLDYIKYLYHDHRSSILLTGYQVEGCNGRLLMDEGKVYLDGTRIKVRCNVEKFDFSAHSGRKELLALIDKIKPKNIMLVHGDPECIASFSKDIGKRARVYTPMVGDRIQIS